MTVSPLIRTHSEMNIFVPPSAKRCRLETDEKIIKVADAVKALKEAKSLMLEKEYTKALNIVESVLDGDPSSACRTYALFLNAGILHKLKDYTNALKLCHKILEKNVKFRTEFNTIFLMAMCDGKLGFYDESLKFYNDLLNMEKITDNRRSMVKWREGWTLYKQGKYNGAIELLKTAKSTNPNVNVKRKIHYWLGMAHYQIKEYDEAEKYLHLATSLFQSDKRKQKIQTTINEIDRIRST